MHHTVNHLVRNAYKGETKLFVDVDDCNPLIRLVRIHPITFDGNIACILLCLVVILFFSRPQIRPILFTEHSLPGLILQHVTVEMSKVAMQDTARHQRQQHNFKKTARLRSTDRLNYMHTTLRDAWQGSL